MLHKMNAAIYLFIFKSNLCPFVFLDVCLWKFIDGQAEEAVDRDPWPAPRPEAFADAAAVGAV